MIKSFVTGSISVINSPITIENFLGDNERIDKLIIAPARRSGFELPDTQGKSKQDEEKGR
jgi:hypothetical protein